MLIRLNSVALTIIAMMPPTLSAICIKSPFEMSSSAMWLTNANRTLRQQIGSEFWPQRIAPRITGVFNARQLRGTNHAAKTAMARKCSSRNGARFDRRAVGPAPARPGCPAATSSSRRRRRRPRQPGTGLTVNLFNAFRTILGGDAPLTK